MLKNEVILRGEKLVKVEIVNIIVTADLEQTIDLETIGSFEYFRYDETTYGKRAAYYKYPRQCGKVSLFSSGKLISHGCKEYLGAISTLKRLRDLLISKKQIQFVELTPELKNIVVKVDYGRSIDLTVFSQTPTCSYEPEIFHGAIVRFQDPLEGTCLVFSSGKAIITGISDFSMINAVCLNISTILSRM